MSQNKIRLILADDNKDFCDVVSAYLNKQEDIEVVATAHDGIDTFNKIREPVSYTHLDVYKRQKYHSGNRRRNYDTY